MIKDKTFIFTGKISITRSDAQAEVLLAGGIPGSSVNKNTDYLVVGDKPGSKLGKAISLGIKIIDEKTFFELLKEKDPELPIEEWKENNIKIVTEDTFVKVLEILEERVQEEKVKKASEKYTKLNSFYSFESQLILSILLRENPELNSRLSFEKVVCEGCGAILPYVIDKYLYCFNCHAYANAKIHACIYEDHPTLPRGVNGNYKVCKICKNIKFFKIAEFCRIQENDRVRDICNSAETFLDIMQMTAKLHKYKPETAAYTLQKYTKEELDEAWTEMKNKAHKRHQRRIEKMQKRHIRKSIKG